MAEVKWIKIVTDIFDDEKILLIESMPEADAIIVIWFKLLCLAGKNNNSGVFLLNERIPYTDEMLSTIFRRPLNTVRLALKTFETYGMVEIVDGTITIPNWGKHQTLDQIEERRDYMRTYMAQKREKQRLLASGKVNSKANSKVNSKANSKANSKVNVNSPEEDIEEDKEDIRESIEGSDEPAPTKPPKKKYGEYGWVKLSDAEYQRLVAEYGESTVKHYIQYIDESAQTTGNKNKWKDWNLVLRKAIKGQWGGPPRKEYDYLA